MERMMFTANYRSRGQVSLRISRDIMRSKKFSKSLIELVERVRDINKDGKFAQPYKQIAIRHLVRLWNARLSGVTSYRRC